MLLLLFLVYILCEKKTLPKDTLVLEVTSTYCFAIPVNIIVPNLTRCRVKSFLFYFKRYTNFIA